MVEIIKETRTRGDTLRPDITLPKKDWDDFKSQYSDKNIRDSVICQLLKKQLQREIVVVYLNII